MSVTKTLIRSEARSGEASSAKDRRERSVKKESLTSKSRYPKVFSSADFMNSKITGGVSDRIKPIIKKEEMVLQVI